MCDPLLGSSSPFAHTLIPRRTISHRAYRLMDFDSSLKVESSTSSCGGNVEVTHEEMGYLLPNVVLPPFFYSRSIMKSQTFTFAGSILIFAWESHFRDQCGSNSLHVHLRSETHAECN
jgi:hypothetical protein